MNQDTSTLEQPMVQLRSHRQRLWQTFTRNRTALIGLVLVILIIVVLLFGAKKIPELAKGLGTGIKEFKKASNDAEKQINAKDDDSVSKKDEGKAA